MDQMTGLELQRLLDRERITARMNRCFPTNDDAGGLDAEWARSIVSADARVQHRRVTLEDIDDFAFGGRFVRDRFRPVWSSGQSHFDIKAGEK